VEDIPAAVLFIIDDILGFLSYNSYTHSEIWNKSKLMYDTGFFHLMLHVAMLHILLLF
jgi:hypothetical protein